MSWRNGPGSQPSPIRDHERIGALATAARTSGNRIHDEHTTERLAFVRATQAVGLTLGEIRGIVGMRDRGETPCGHVLEFVHRRAAEVD